MEEGYKVGYLRAIGVSTFYSDRLVDLCRFVEVQTILAALILCTMLLTLRFQRYFSAMYPTRDHDGIVRGDETFGVLTTAIINVPLYACGGGTILLLQTWLADSMSMGGASAFMLTGPSTKITNLGALIIVLG